MNKIKIAGFTLIELLIVIALLGTLAVALLAALDPLEQIKKGRDTGVRNTVSEVLGAAQRFYAINGSMPYSLTLAWGNITTASVQMNALTTIVATGELKSDFTALSKDQLGQIYMTGTQEKLIVCFNPGSKAVRSDVNTKYAAGSNGTIDTLDGCPNSTGTVSGGTCYWCVY